MVRRTPDKQPHDPITGWHLDKRIPVALILTLLVYGIGAVWWASKTEVRLFVHDNRITMIERNASDAARVQGLVLERLARIEEKNLAVIEALNRIEKRLERK